MTVSEIPLQEQKILRNSGLHFKLLFGADVAVPPLLRPDGSLTYCPKENSVMVSSLLLPRMWNSLLFSVFSIFLQPSLLKKASQSPP